MDLIEKTTQDNCHPWELSRTQCILDIVKRNHFSSVVDIGAGDRFFISKLKEITSCTLYAIDTEYNEKSKIIDGIHCKNNISEIDNHIDMAILMDVLEHVHNDDDFLKVILKKLSSNALLIITVPAFQFLFSDHDFLLKHHRRYNKKQLLDLLQSNNLIIEKYHYFYFSLFFIRLLSLPLTKRKTTQYSGIGKWRFKKKHILTQMIRIFLNIDFRICAFFAWFHIYLPGLSFLAICRMQGKSID